jgi:hypothetical protein
MYFPILLNEFQASRAATAWVGSLNNGIYMLAGYYHREKLGPDNFLSNLFKAACYYYYYPRSDSHIFYTADRMPMDGYDRWHDIHDRTGFEQRSAQPDYALFHLRRNYRYVIKSLDYAITNLHN